MIEIDDGHVNPYLEQAKRRWLFDSETSEFTGKDTLPLTAKPGRVA